MKKILFLNLIFLCVQADEYRKPDRPKPTLQEVFESPAKPGKPFPSTQGGVQKPKDDAPINAAEASAILQVAGGFFHLLNAPNDPTHISTGIGAMASGMATLLYQLMKSKGFDTELSDDELQDLADEMTQMVNHGVEVEMVRRSALAE